MLRRDRLRGNPLFARLKRKVEEEILPFKARSALSHHASQCCRDKTRGKAPIHSLKSAGMDAPIARPDGLVRVRVQFENSFEYDDGQHFVYTSPGFTTHQRAVMDTCMELLAYLLGLQPNQVRLPQRCFKRG